MKKSLYTDSQILSILKQAKAGTGKDCFSIKSGHLPKSRPRFVEGLIAPAADAI